MASKTQWIDKLKAEQWNLQKRKELQARVPADSIVHIDLSSLAQGEYLDEDIIANNEVIGAIQVDCRHGSTIRLADIDIFGPFENFGFGTQAMRLVLRTAQARGFHRLEGQMRGEYKQKLTHFYSKFHADIDGLDFSINLEIQNHDSD